MFGLKLTEIYKFKFCLVVKLIWRAIIDRKVKSYTKCQRVLPKSSLHAGTHKQFVHAVYLSCYNT